MMEIKIILVLSLSLGLSSAQLIQSGQCDPNIQLQTNFNITQFFGTWYEVRRAANTFQTSDCSYLEIEDNDGITLYNRAVNNNFLEETRGNGTLENGTARFTFTIDNNAYNFWILSTDYTNFAIAYACENLGNTERSVYIWQLGRASSFPTDMLEGLMNQTLITIVGTTVEALYSLDHSEDACRILPDIPAGQPVIFPGQCNPNMSVVQNFNVTQFMGVWHQISNYYSDNGQGTCNRAEYTLSGNMVDVVNSQVVNRTLNTVAGNATLTTSDNSARLLVTLEVVPNVYVQSPLWILATDYTSYAVSYTCTDLPNNERRVNTWILSRSRQITEAAQAAVNRVIRSEVDLNSRFLTPANQSDNDCLYFRDPVPGQSVTFRGQCDPDIQVMQNFDAQRYMGLWHNIESYPSTFQGGSCNNANYTLVNGTVDVFNTQVVDQRLDTISGVATVTATDGSAKLSVNFPIAGTNLTTDTDYWVLDTDYESYAFVYSCSNLENDERRIGSWKLSRTKVMPSNGTLAINAIIDTIPVLNQQYFETDDQSADGCFYFPEPQPGVPVRFPGQCENINVTQNFDLSRFQGTWYEIQAYPKEQQPGQCISHAFSLSGNNFTLVTSSVNDQFQTVSNSNVTINSAEESAKMIITINANGQEIQIPYWIVDTDYNNYALAYSCVNVDEDYRMVYSWKLSRTRQLSTASVTAINATMSNVTVLEERYFETVDQTDVACFYLPEIPAGQPIILNGQCDLNIRAVQNFNATNYLGRWRLIESYGSDFQTGTCNEATYSLSNDTVLVYNTQVIDQTLNSITGSATVASVNGSGILRVTFPGAATPIEYWILDTDYTTYSLVYSCTNINTEQRRVWSWKLSRLRDLTPTAIANMNRIINTIEVLNNRYYELLDQSDAGCFYYPNPGTSPVIFRGQCDLNINVVTNFNATAYMNLWHDVSSYPSGFQEGTCNNAFYTLVGGTVDVFNTQVIDQRLDTISGSARLAGTDGSGRLIVDFPVAGTNLTTETPYWVLATDYESYALVYSCVNIDDEYRQVWSWKLSRSKVLPAAANNSINAVINTVPVLDNRYYIDRDQSRDGCFYFPEPTPGVPVVFPGQCDETIQAVANFNMSSFQGIWYEIEAYPKDQQTGQCVNHEYTLNNTVLELVSSNVINQVLGFTNSRVTFQNATDNSGKLDIILTTGQSVITIPFWIISTDYYNYALAYSCVNLNEDFRGVYSWKLSRTKQLRPVDVTAINNAMTNINVLENRYFENIDQSDNACFYLPDPVPGEPVVFIGQCDRNIPVMQNFEPARYLGRWRLIQSYPERSQVGTCIEANYSLNPDNSTVDVYNTQVIGQELNTINGTAVLASNDGSGRLLVYFPQTTVSAEYWILDTDYDSYALVYGCNNLDNNQRRVTSWKLSRTNQLTPNAIERINQVVNSINVLNNQYYANIDRSDQACFYYPVPDGSPVVFRGQCDANIPVVTNFNATAYMGLWHDIASYTSGFQDGTCNNAFYTLVGDTVDVFNTQVIDQSLDTITGVARLASTDGSARLIVNFPVAGTNLTIETPYWVLATDYVSYSLVYTCINLNLETRQVWSWKLSRSKELSAPANTTINSVINTIPVLDDRYYEIKNQTDEGCFYFPEPSPGVPVVFPGQCDESIQAVPNFNMSQFIGVWHEIETYPKEQQTGECINHSYSLSTANILNLISSSIRQETMNITTSTVSFQNAQDSSGRLVITLLSGGINITIPFWILSTNYTDYALAYSCVNLENSSRAVYSWKLSRSRQLSAAGIAAINSTIETVQVLENRYYEPVDQSDLACFYLPDVIPGQPVLFPGQCDSTIPVVQNFNATAYAGRWRMIETYISDFQSQQGTCADATYTLTGGAVAVTNTQVINQVLDVTTGSATLATTDGQAKLLVTFPNAPVADYWVLSTDYDSYALVYSCLNVSTDQRRVWTWKLSRTPDLTPAAVTEINRVVNTIDVLNERYYTRIDHSDNSCFYYPTPNGEPVEFRGQCDMNIPVVTNFNVTAYLGLWYDIAAYPTSFQGGTCENAEYSLGDGVVDVFNTQVINQTLNTINGSARLNTTDGQAKLLVNFPIAGTNLTTEAPYWVLATDYTTFSLVYSCVNINTERRRVSSWMLSRTKELPVAANNSINAIINTVPVLDNRYYDVKDQTDEGCFYFPEALPGVPVVFPGQCDQSVQAVANFNMSAFVGVWYEIETYPKEQQTGECVSHTYSQNTGNVLELVSSSIRNEMLNETSSRVSFESTQDSSGRLIITLTSGGNTITIPFWILSTDYTEYALAYSCVNLEQNTRAVYSWKLSRSRVLSAAGAVAINNRINTVVVLDNKYYEPVDQSDRACFYLPELTPGQPVIFPGQCNPNITVVQNFNATAYAGRWRMIETYISDFQSQQGTCADATYTLTGSTVAVSNTQVIDQLLDVTIGSAILATTDGQAKLLVTFPNASEATDYWVLSTDYTSYALVYSCRNVNEEQRRVWTWKLSRTRDLTAAAVTEIDRVVNTIDVLNERYYTRVDHSDNGCFYFPTPDGEPVRFRGQCNMNIPVVTNFNVTAYTGTWYDIQSYPVRFQDGTCPTATYSLGSTGVDVYNTQVVGQQLDTINGVAELASTDGSARLIVTFPVVGTNFTVTTSYWVLATDYSNYALVYSCENINEEYRSVSSWKLSRTTSLIQASVTAINNVINTIPVLREEYYVTRGHTEADCFYYPDNNGGPVMREGQCDLNNLNVITNFNATAFTGSWYEISRYPSELQEGECVTKEFSLDQQFNMRNKFVYNERITNLSGPATLATDGRGVISVNLTGAGGEVFSTTYHILDVEYNDFALLYGCRNYNTSHAQVYSWKLSRTQTLSNTAITRINTIVNNTLDLFEGYFEETDNTPTGCFHYPVFDELPTSIELIGACDESITAKANFNVTAYLGIWYETASYPQAFQSGLCARAQYSLGTNGVDVLNSQVVNSTLEIQIASAVVASNDGSGLLDVTFVLSNGIINVVRYYVLETDYSSFSLVYSCRNLPNGNRTVSSWKLSRTTTLPQQAEPIIDNIIANTQGLINEYYRPTSQTEEACFYIPEVNKNEAPQFRGRCENIEGVQNFDAQRYLGWWHEIESYPTDNDKGTCVSSDISQIGNEFIVTDTNVFGTTAQVNTSTVTISSNGRLRKTYSDGQIVDLWVLATDYENYALLYSCENIGTEYMRVWSAKHSKSRQLSQAAQNAMDPFIQNTRALETQFYQPVDQSDSACFYYPEPTGDQIILPGQCDENIPIVQDFSPGEYSGTWYQVERYPQLFENGTCVGARYTLNENTGVVDVTNWQVVGDVLDVVEGTATVNSTDGSAMLIVRLPIRHTEDIEPIMVSMRLYVLTTDYLSYSLAYSCENVGPYRRAVGVWKLSRTRTMTAAGDAAINTIMNSREELHQPYFLQVEQNEDCDEPSNAIIFKSSIIIMIVCSILHLLL